MDSDLEELESLFSDHFGRTPLTTPAGSQEGDSDERDSEQEELQQETVDSVVDVRVRQFLHGQDDEAHATGSDVENDDDGDHESDDEINTDYELDSERDSIVRFARDGCGCKQKCYKKVTEKMIEDHIFTVREMSKGEKEMYMIGTMRHGNEGETTKRGKKRMRSRILYTLNGQEVCRATYMLAFDIKHYALNSLVKYVKSGGQTPRSHGNKGRKPKHAITYVDVRRVVDFLLNYADTYGLPQPAAPRGTDNIPPIYLDAETTKSKLHKQYASVCEGQSVRALKHTSFYDIWGNCLPHIRIASPRDDVCATCESNRKKIMMAVDEEEKLQATQNFRSHIENAQKERSVYNACIQRAKQTYQDSREERYNHYTFDFAQCVSIPHFSRQLGPVYFTSLRKIQIFGVRIDGEPRQLNFLVDEAETIGKDGTNTHGPNAVISMLHHVLEVYGQGEPSIALHADNCPGQNKNRFLIGYLVWRVLTGRNKSVEYLMQVPRHARCLVDGGFGHLKRLYRRSNVETLNKLEEVVKSSAHQNDAVRYPAWQWRDWKSVIGPMFKQIPGIRKYQYFKMTADEPGIVTVRQGDGQPDLKINVRCTATEINPGDLPPVLLPGGLTRRRKEYLYRTVRQYLHPDNQEATCPTP